MGSDLHAGAVRQTEAALRGLAESLAPGPVLPGLLATPLARMGDALRLGIELPQPVRRWSEGISRPDLQGALASVVEETESWTLPTVHGDGGAADPSLVFVVRRRDETESVRHAVRRICLPRQLNPYEFAEFATLEAVLRMIDGRIGSLLSRADVVRLLGTRAAMEPRWADGFTERGGVDQATDAENRWPESIRSVVPSDEIVSRYVTRGALSRYVEGVADANDNFADDLASYIDTLIDAREDVGLVARRWRKGARATRVGDPLCLRAIPAPRLAASDTAAETDTPRTCVELGMLSPIDAYARIEVTAQNVTLYVSPNEQRIERVEFGDLVLTSPTDSESWQLSIPVPTGAVRLRVVVDSGAQFAEEFRLAPDDAGDEAQ